MGWWEQSSSRWEMAIVAQVGGAAIVGAGAFFLSFRSPDLPVRPNFLAVAGGIGLGGSIGSAISIPWRSVIRQLINPRAVADTASIGWNALSGSFACRDIQRAGFAIAQVGGSAVVVGGQLVYVYAHERGDIEDSEPDRRIFSSQVTLPRSLPQLGSALFDLPQIQGGLGAGAFAFDGVMFYVGT
jgi:hypothetical protein